MSMDSANMSQIEDEFNDLVMQVEFIYEILRNRMSHFETLPDIDNAKEVLNYAKSLAEDTEELLEFLVSKE